MFVTLKHTVSAKQRSEVGDEVFVSVGQEIHNVPVDSVDEYKESLGESVASWLENRVSATVASVAESYADPDEEEAEEKDEDEEEEEADELTYDDVAKMKHPALKALIKEHEVLSEVNPKLKVEEMRAEILAILFDEEEDEEEPDEEDEDEDEEEADDPYEEDELKALKLAELQEIADAWEIAPKIKAGTDMKGKKAIYVKAILDRQEELIGEEE